MSSKSGRTLIGLLGDIAANTAKNASSIDRLVASIGGGGSGVPDEAITDPREEIFICYAVATGKVRKDGHGISVEGPVFNLNGEREGRQLVSWQVSDNPDDLKDPENPKVSIDEEGPIAQIPVSTVAQGTWTFNDGSTLTAIGVGRSSVVELDSATDLARDDTAMTITGGTGRYEGASGLRVSIGSILTPAGGIANQSGLEVTQRTIEVFRITRQV